MASNDCITNTTRYSVRRAGLLFCIGFESNGNWMQIKHAMTTLADMSSSGGCETQWISRDEGSDR